MFSYLQSCNYFVKYEMNSIMTEDVDITELIESGKFRISVCDGGIDKLIKINPFILNEKYEIELQNRLQIWYKIHFKSSQKIKFSTIYKKTIYQYSYLLSANEILDVYKTKVKNNSNLEKEIFIRLDQKGYLINEFKEDGWVINSCE